MYTTMRERATRAAGRWVFGLAFLLPLMAGAAAPTVSITSIMATPQTNYNGSVVTASYTGDLDGYDVKFMVNGTSYSATAGGGTMTFVVPGNAVVASNIYLGTITATKGSDTYTIGGKYLYQGAQISGGGGTNGWFKTWAEDRTLKEQGGAWDAPKPPADVSKIIIDEDDKGVCNDFVFTPGVQANVSQVAVVDMTLSFDAPLDEAVDVTDVQAAIRIVTVGDTYRFAALANGAWTTNTEIAAQLKKEYPVRMTVDYRQVPATITYAVKDGDAYQTIASGVSGTTKSAIVNVTFNGTGKLALMTGSNVVDSVDASLVKDGDGTRYRWPDDVPSEKRGNLTLLWNTAWTPAANVDGAWTIHGGDYQLYINPTGEGVWVKNTDGTWTVKANYFEAMNLYFGDNVVTTNKYTYFTNAVALADETITNLYLLHDVTLDTTLAVNKTLTFNGEDRILAAENGVDISIADGKSFTIQGGLIGLAQSVFTGKGTLAITGGRFNDTTKGQWTVQDYSICALATPVRSYGWQLIETTKAPDPEKGEELMPMTDANGESVSVVVNTSWVNEKFPDKSPAEQSVELSKVQANGMTRFDNEVLGLATSGTVSANNIPVITPHQSTSTKNVTFSLGNVNQSTITASGANVKYRVVTSSDPGGKDGAASSYVAPAAEVQMPLPTSQEGVKYYLIEVDTGAVK